MLNQVVFDILISDDFELFFSQEKKTDQECLCDNPEFKYVDAIQDRLLLCSIIATVDSI
jgi:hypothetical protein